MLQVRERVEDDRRGDPLRRGDEHDLVRPLDREAGERTGYARAEIEEHSLVEGGQKRDELAVALGPEACCELGVARRAEEM